MRTCFLSLATALSVSSSLLAGAGARADVVETLSRSQLTKSLRNAVCEILLHTEHARDRVTDVGWIRTHQTKKLRVIDPRPGHFGKLEVNELGSGVQHRSMTDHLRGAELWARHAADDPSIHVSTVSFVGPDEIRAYYALGEAAARRLDQIAIPERLRDRVRAKMQRINVAVAVGLVGTAAGILSGQWPEGSTALAVPIVAGLTYVAYVAHRFRFDEDDVRSTFDLRVKDYLEAGAADQRMMWDFSSRTYRVLNPLVDALWTEDQAPIAEQLGRFQLFSVFPLSPNVVLWPIDRYRHGADIAKDRVRTRGDGYVVVDRLLSYDEDRQQPRLTIVLRTSARTPAAVVTELSKRAAAPIADGDGPIVPALEPAARAVDSTP